MATAKYLIVNADDFGISRGVNAGIIEAHERGIVTSTSLMTRWPAAAEAAEYAKSHRKLGVGLHIDLSEWIYHNDQWEPLYEVVSLSDAAAVRKEVRRQVDAFRELVGRAPDHIDSHQHAHRQEPVLSIAVQIASELTVPLRHFTPSIRYCGEFYGQDEQGDSYPDLISAEVLTKLIRKLPAGIHELCCHPAREVDFPTMYRAERSIELQSLCDAGVARAVRDSGLELRRFSDLPRDLPAVNHPS